MTKSDTRTTKQGETRREVARGIAGAFFASWMTKSELATLEHLTDTIEAALNAEREQALTDAARQACLFCAGAKGFNPIPVEAVLTAETDTGNYVHRNDPPHGLAGVYCKAPRIRSLIAAIRKDQG